MQVTVATDSNSTMALIKETLCKHGLAYLLIPLYMYMLNMVEGAVNYFKASIASILLSACMMTGPLTVWDINMAAAHLCYVHECFTKAHVSDTY